MIAMTTPMGEWIEMEWGPDWEAGVGFLGYPGTKEGEIHWMSQRLLEQLGGGGRVEIVVDTPRNNVAMFGFEATMPPVNAVRYERWQFEWRGKMDSERRPLLERVL